MKKENVHVCVMGDNPHTQPLVCCLHSYCPFFRQRGAYHIGMAITTLKTIPEGPVVHPRIPNEARRIPILNVNHVQGLKATLRATPGPSLRQPSNLFRKGGA